MSSYSSRYQSRLLNFISQQSRKVVDKCDRALRHLKFAAEGAVQATLYPVYLLLQTARAIGKQLQQVGKKTASQLGNTVKDENLNYPEADAPIQRVLSFLQELSLPGSTTETNNYQNTTQFFSPKMGEVGATELPVFKDLIATSAEALAKLDNKLEKSSNSPLLALGAAPEIPKSPIGDTMKLGFTHASAEALAKLDKSLDSCLPAPELSMCDRPLIVVGVATAIATRNLVLVAPENQTLDILTAQQQQEIQQKIFSEVADYWQQRQRVVERQLGFNNDLQLVADRANLFGLFRQFIGVMSWVQTSPVAVKVNLFGEANLLLAKIDNSISNYQLANAASTGFQQLGMPLLPTNGKEESTEFTPFLPRKSKGGLREFISLFSTKSKEESKEFIPPLPTASKKGRDYQLPITNSSLPLVRGAIAPIAPSQESPENQEEKYTKYRTVNSLGFLQTKQSQPGKIVQQEEKPTKLTGIERVEDYVEQTVELILSAITYFFGGKEEQSEKELAEHIYAKYQIAETSHSQLDIIKSDRALETTETTEIAWSDLFGQTTAETNSLQEKIDLLNRLAGETSYTSPSETLEFNAASIAAKLGNTQNLSHVNHAATVLTQQTTTAVAIGEPVKSGSVKPAPDWWEAQVISRGYIKHPLEQTLEWLDIALLWVEEMGLQLWDWAKIQLDKILSSKN